MKVIITIFILSLVGISASAGNEVTISKLKIDPAGETVTISFNVLATEEAVKSDYSLIITPVLIHGQDKAGMPPIIIQGRRAKIATQRQAMSLGNKNLYPNAHYASNGASIPYTISLPYNKWMEGGQVVLEKVYEGCCNTNELPNEVLADNLVIIPEPEQKPAVIIYPKLTKQTTGDSLAETYPWVIPLKKKNDVLSREENQIINFRLNESSPIDRDYMDNDAVLVRILSATNALGNSTDSRIVHIDIVGYASPEGSIEVNNRLAQERAATLKSFILHHSKTPEASIITHNGSADWNGLRTLVAASGMAYKDEVLHIIDNTPVWDAKQQIGRMGKLMALKGGEPYRYMLKEYFPQLRNAAYIRLYYENK